MNNRRIDVLRKQLSASTNAYRPFAKEKIEFDDSAVARLTVPDGAVYALLLLEVDATATDKAKSARFWATGDNPTSTDGLSRGDLDAWDLEETSVLANFKIIGIESGKTHTLQVQYYK